MYADRNKKGLSPGAMGAALVINAGLFAVLMSLTPDFIKIVDPTIVAYPVPLDPTPPPPPPKPEVKKVVETQTPKTEIFVKPPIIDLKPTDSGLTVTNIEPPKYDTITGEGTGGTVTVDPPKPAPVLTGIEIDPRYANDFQPDYPADMRRAGTEGVVTVRVLVGTDGRVKAIEVQKTPSDSFFNVTKRQALSKWRFKPATVDGVPVEKWRTMTLRFSLTDA